MIGMASVITRDLKLFESVLYYFKTLLTIMVITIT